MKENTSPLFEEIYNAAKQADIGTLRRIYQQNLTLEVNSRGNTPSSKLAAEGNVQALECLKQFPHNFNWIARGFAQGGNSAAAFECMYNHGVSIDWVANGFAFSNRSKAAFECVVKHNARIGCVANGFAEGGHSKEAFECVDMPLADIDIDWLANSFARGGHPKEALECVVKRGAKIDYVVRGLARCGDSVAAIECETEQVVDLWDVAVGSAQGGHSIAALECVTDDDSGVTINFIAHGFAFGGHCEAALECVAKRGAKIEQVAFGVIANSYYNTEEQLLSILQFCPTATVRDKLISLLRKQYQKELKEAAVQLNPSSSSLVNPSICSLMLLSRSDKLIKLKSERELGFNLAYAWLSNSTLRMIMLNFKPNHHQRIFLNPHCFYLVCMVASRKSLSLNAIKTLYNAIQFHVIDKAPLLDMLEKYCHGKISSFFTQTYRQQASQLLEQCKVAQSKEQLSGLLKQSLENVELTDPFYTLLTNHLHRLTLTERGIVAIAAQTAAEPIDKTCDEAANHLQKCV